MRALLHHEPQNFAVNGLLKISTRLSLFNLVEWIAIKTALGLPAEVAHDLTLRYLRSTASLTKKDDDPHTLKQTVFGLNFANPVGMAAGIDKDGEAVDGLFARGCGFCEIGTITPEAQTGNPKKRLYRLCNDQAVINRFGFNSRGHAFALERLQNRQPDGKIIGVNVGSNKKTIDRAADYVAGVDSFAPHASYFTINVSSPNTPSLRDLQQAAALDDLLARVVAARDAAAARHGRRPVLLKIAPDLTLQELDGIVAVARRRGLDGLIVSNTTVARPAGLRDSAAAAQAGGLSGRPLFRLSTFMLAQAHRRVEGAFPLVGVGGIDSAEAAWIKIRAGASLVQLYTGLVYQGPGLIARIKHGLAERLAREGLASIGAAVGGEAETIARELA